MSEVQRKLWDVVYRNLVEAQAQAMRMSGDRDAHEFYQLIGEARREAERIAPDGWSSIDIGYLPLLEDTT